MEGGAGSGLTRGLRARTCKKIGATRITVYDIMDFPDWHHTTVAAH